MMLDTCAFEQRSTLATSARVRIEGMRMDGREVGLPPDWLRDSVNVRQGFKRGRADLANYRSGDGPQG